jgi:hypothetical protein
VGAGWEQGGSRVGVGWERGGSKLEEEQRKTNLHCRSSASRE